ncbi:MULTISPECIES: hypothetical protein [Chryseobacterium]|uniref:DUF4270 family protein n=1 Tax=Chryseobacterium camelliae TaxID=1265445 RepID=A0ABU0TD99_9FLAO|nr:MULTISPECIES: hypothetical protein [Chryseobacterium]MDT3407158.1 hypothetical protein [Pseudacidovorax intermedius]MDQ1095051.1 hypothetical protein [Chryseobacterium camelliae]MDQ1098990.1 hypothetical protein [Chryseobacterium sp. SORGH_AS_1048]MDR6086338.1 hypothetical protein [Chryseobacterium sp. SORGH_AS_0909]MDR6130710.1 hypothetical protein [Chryseobacterium sp. SORGH_AS_1175]
MKKIFLYILAGSLCFSACKKDDEAETFVEPEDVSVRNSYDEQAIQKFMDDNYLDTQGNIKAFSSTDASDDNYKKLSELNPVKLPSGVIYIIRAGAQPTAGKTIGTDTMIRTMIRGNYYLATDTDGNVAFNNSYSGTLINTIDGQGSPVTDPLFYYVKNIILENATSDAAKQRSYYEIEGFQEGLKYFQSFDNKPDSDGYNLQGVIIVPSKAAFGRDLHYNYVGTSLQNRCFVFNFQLYNAVTPRPASNQ